MDARIALDFVRRWLLVLFLGPLLSGVAAFLVVREMPYQYEGRVTLLVGQGSVSSGIGTDELRGAEQLARTYAEVVRTRPILEEAASQVGLSLPFRELQQRVGARFLRDTQLLRITAEDTDPARAALFANAVAETFINRTLEAQAGRFASSRENLARLVDTLRGDMDIRTREVDRLNEQPASPARDAELSRQKSELAQMQTTHGASVRSYEELRIVEARGMNTLTVLEPAVTPEQPVGPSRFLLISLAALAGLVLAASVAAAAEYLDDGLRNRERVLAATGLIALGEIPQIEEAAGWNRPASRRVVESYRLLLTSLQVATLDRNVRKIMVASAGIGEGKSLTSSNLAAIFAETGRRVILVDADLHRPTQMLAFNLPNRDGLTTLMLDQGRPASSLLRETALPNLKVITSGPSVADPSGLFSSKRLEDRLTELCALCDVLIFDTPPIVAQPDAVILGSHMDAVLFVVDASKSRGRVVTRTVEMLNDSGAAVVGVVLNRVPKKSTAYYYGYYGDYDRSGDEHRQNGAAAANDVGGRVAEEESTRAGQKR